MSEPDTNREADDPDGTGVTRRRVLGSLGGSAAALGGLGVTTRAAESGTELDPDQLEALESKRSEYDSEAAVARLVRSRVRPLVSDLAGEGLLGSNRRRPAVPTEIVSVEDYADEDECVVVDADLTGDGASAHVQFKMEVEGTRLHVSVLPHQDREYAIIGEGDEATIVERTDRGDLSVQNCVSGMVCYWKGGLYNGIEREIYCCIGESCYWGGYWHACVNASNGPCCMFCNYC